MTRRKVLTTHAEQISTGGTVISVTGTEKPDSARYQEVADKLRRRIRLGVLIPGQAMPSEAALRAEFGYSNNTIRQAIAQLRTEGLVVTEKGRGSFVRPQPPITRLRMDRYRLANRADSPPPGVGASLEWPDIQIKQRMSEEPADRELASLFRLTEDSPLLARWYLLSAFKSPRMTITSYYPMDLVAGTNIAVVSPDDRPDSIAMLAGIGIEVTKVREIARARMPMAEESAQLAIVGISPVLAVTRLMYARDRVVEVARDIVYPADRIELDYEIDL